MGLWLYGVDKISCVGVARNEQMIEEKTGHALQVIWRLSDPCTLKRGTWKKWWSPGPLFGHCGKKYVSHWDASATSLSAIQLYRRQTLHIMTVYLLP